MTLAQAKTELGPAVYLAKGEDRFATPAVDDKYAEDAPGNLDQHTENRQRCRLFK